MSQGQFISQNGANVSGIAAVYDQGNGSYVVQLQGISATLPTSPNRVDATINGVRISGQTLQFTSGTFNYNFTASPGASFQAVYIHCVSCATFTDYATATPI